MTEKHNIIKLDGRLNRSQIFLGTVEVEGAPYWFDIAQAAVDQQVVTEPGKYLAINADFAATVAVFEVEAQKAPLKVVGGR